MNESAGKRRIEVENFFEGFFVIPEVVDGIGRADVVTAETDGVGSSFRFWRESAFEFDRGSRSAETSCMVMSATKTPLL